jgi:acylphosphatase
LVVAARQRVDVHYSGRVQGVGFRQSTTEIACPFVVTGYVQNLPDGRVRLVAEGERDELTRFLKVIDERLGALIREKTMDWGPANGEFQDFSIWY